MNLKQLYIFGMENSQEPVIKNPVLRAALEEPRTMAQAPLTNELEPGALRDEMLKGFDPSQETHEEYLQRINLERPFNAAQGGMIGKPGGLVEPGIEYYAKFKSSSSKLRQLQDRTWKYITHDNEHITGEKKSDVIKKMKKRSELSQKKLDIQKKATAEKMAKSKTTYEGAGKHLNKVTTGPNKNVLYRYAPVGGAQGEYNKIKHFKDKTDAQNWVKEAIESTGRITDEKFLELRNSNKAMNNLEFANFLNKETDFKGIRGEKFTPHNVRNRQILLDVGPTGEKLEFTLSKKEVLDTVKDMKDGPQKIKAWKKAGSTDKGFKNLESIVRKKKNYERIREEGYFETEDFKTRRKKALSKYEQSGKAKIARLKEMETKGIFPRGDPELDLWRDLYSSSQTKNPRLVLKTKKPKTVLTKQGNKIIPWYTDDNYKKVKFLDTQTGKTITFNNLKKYLGEEKYNEVLRPYQEKYLIKDTEIMYKGQKRKVGTLINEGVFGPVKDYPVEGYFHVHHPRGKGKDPFFTQLASWDANKAEWRPRENLIKKINKAEGFGAKREIVEEFIENTKKFNILTQPGKTLYGTDIPFQEKLKIAGQEAGLLKNKDFVKFFKGTFQGLSPQSVLQMGKTHGCFKKQEGGSVMRCLQTKFNDDPAKFLQRSAPLVKNNVNLRKWFLRGRNIARGTGVFAAWEAVFAPVIAGWGKLEGDSHQRILHDLFYGSILEGVGVPPEYVPGQNPKEEFMEYAGGGEKAEKAWIAKRIDEIQGEELPYLQQQRNDVINKMSNVEGKSFHQRTIEDDIKEKELELQDLWNKSGFEEGPAGGALWQQADSPDAYFNMPAIIEADQTYTGAKDQIAADTAERKKATFDWLEKNKIIANRNWQSQLASGGIASLNVKK
jgi:hypothetical protein